MRAPLVVFALLAVSAAARSQAPPPYRTVDAPFTNGLLTGQPVAAAQELLPEGPPPRPLPKLPAANDPVLELVEFRDIPLQDAFRLLSQQSGLKIVPSAEAAKTKVSLYLRDVAASTAVSAIAQANGLIVRQDGDTDIIRVHTAKENQRDLASFRDEQTRVFTLLYPNAVNVAKAIQDLFGPRVALSYGATEQLHYFDLQQRLARFRIFNQLGFGIGTGSGSNIIGAGVGGIGGVGGLGALGGGGLGGLGGGLGGGFGGGGLGGGLGGFGGGLGGGGFGGGLGGGFGGGFGGGINQQFQLQNLYQQAVKPEERLRNLTPEEIQQLEQAFAGKDGPDRSAIYELLSKQPATIYVTVVKTNNQIVVRTSDPNVMAQIDDLICKLDIPTPAVLLEVKILSIDLSDEFASTFDWQFTDGALTAGSFTTGNLLPPFADQLPSAARRFNTIAPGPFGASPQNTAMFQIVSANFRARLQLLEDKHRVTTLATPLLMTANNEVSEIFTGELVPVTIGFNSAQTVATGTNTATVAPTPNTVLQNIGTTLLVTPNINADRTVTLRIQQQNSSVKKDGATIPFVSSDGATTNQVPVDTVQQQTLTGTFIAKDGLAMAVGGLIQEGVSDSRREVPILGRVPGLGVFFRTQSTKRTRSELIILIRPFVLNTAVESAAVTRNLLEATTIHPNVQSGNMSTLGTFLPGEVAVPNPPVTNLQRLFRVHMVQPKDY